MNPRDGDDRMVAAGIDLGSSAAKVVLFEDDGDGGGHMLVGRSERIRRRDPGRVALGLFDACLGEAGLDRGRLSYIATTGEGEAFPDRTGHFYGMTSHARGALHLDPAARAVIDIGALHTRAVLMDGRAKVLGYRMTSQCASGSGQFLENICRYLGVAIAEIGSLSLTSRDPEASSSICAVLAETDVINMVSRGIQPADIIKGIHQSMAGRYLKLLTALGAEGRVLITGGLAADAGLLAALNEAAAEDPRADFAFHTHPDSVLAGALGAAIWGAFRSRKLAARGIELGAA